ncbi:phage tail length tape measure family protein [Erwinia pyrifoliae]|uniref:Phage tail length tape measure family protein n=1 Tax=Erwinia pyrifoliae TaxID=79967 RepID=A0ABY5X8I2_ERWPY|nr:phage tail length tape measure family protein [Erwinia pyrifoliae]AUX74321.1 phage tail tape-measure protein [Erwinia pyrifoliae]MCA8875322.1 phage tail tape-measure protein [Erwinia pyrifoliae]UWS33705.1 phage tail length tape measure family protein [Erwinia pyrifoliae]CAX53812.1 conserved uncharacterized protein [Erwinia pyrifoliae Ep1/96]CAY72340.1 Extracellular matrix-binding protein ebhB; ECM-binding protein homolog B; Flags: Precursor [Erwinia pyrifoliae DSM 12163]
MSDVKAGGIYYEVGADLEPLLKGVDKAGQALNGMGKEAGNSAAGFSRLETQAKKSAIAVNEAASSANRLRTISGQMGYQLQDVAVQLQMGQSALMVFAQQGSQMAGAFGPSGAVVGAVIAVAGAIGSALIPALFSGKTTAEDLQKTLSELDKVITFSQSGVAALSDKYALLAKTNGALAEAVRENALSKLEQDAAKAGEAIKGVIAAQQSFMPSLNGGASSVILMGNAMAALNITTADYQQASSAGMAFQSQAMTIGNTVGMLASNFGITNQQAYTLAQRMIEVANTPTPQAVSQLNGYLKDLHGTTDKGSAALLDFKTSITDAGAAVSDIRARLEEFRASMSGAIATAQQQQTFEGLIANLKQQEIGYKQGAAAAKAYAIEHANLTETQKKEVLAQNAATESARQAAEDRRKADNGSKAGDSAVTGLARLSQQYDVARLKAQGMNKEAAQLAAVQSLGAEATDREARAASNLAGKIFDLTNAEEKRRQARQGQKFAGQEIAAAQTQKDPLTGQSKDPLAQINLQEQQKLDALAQYQAIDKQNIQIYEDAKTAIQQQAANARKQIAIDEANTQSQAISSIIGSVSQGFDGLANLAAGAAGKSSGAYQAMFALSKGFAVAQSALNLQLALSQVLANPADLTPAQKFASYAAVASAGASLLSTIGSISYGGGRKNGGPVSEGTMYQVGEGGKPEIYQASTGKQYMIPGDNGKVISNKDMQGGGGGGVVMNVAFNIQTTNGIDEATQKQIVKQMENVAMFVAKRESTRPRGILQRRK